MSLLSLVSFVSVASLSAAPASLTEASRLAAIYDTILTARFEEAEARITASCPPAPPEACATLRTVTLWWRITLDPDDRSWDERFEKVSAEALAAAERWTVREPGRAEAWFYLAGAHAPRAQWQALRGERLAAARNGKRIKDALERALALDPDLHDAHFGIGLYRYYADVAPAALKFFRWMLLLPGGDRREGLQQMLQARARGELLRGEADFQLHWIYTWYEKDHRRAIELLEGLDRRHPSNPIFLIRVAEIQRDALGDGDAAAATWQQLLDRAAGGSIAPRAFADARARLGLAERALAKGDADRALQVLAPIVGAGRDAAYGSRARAHLLAGQAFETLGSRERAASEYRSAIASAPERDVHDSRARARAALRRIF
jgi:tetratricopeptide (TPR) repeat protein